MFRREFLRTTPAIFCSNIPVAVSRADAAPEAAQRDDTRWQPDGWGSLGRLGLLVPHNEIAADSEVTAMVPQGVAVHVMRVRYQGVPGSGASVARARSFAEPPFIDEAAELLTEVRPNAIMYGFTSSSYALGPEGDAAFRRRLEAKAKSIPILTCLAAVSGFHALGARRVALVHPPWFSDDIDQRSTDYFQQHGFEVVSRARALKPGVTMQDVRPDALYQWAVANVPKAADAVFFGGNGMRAVAVIQALERSLGMPVLTSNQVCVWDALRLANLPAKIAGYGRLFNL